LLDFRHFSRIAIAENCSRPRFHTVTIHRMRWWLWLCPWPSRGELRALPRSI